MNIATKYINKRFPHASPTYKQSWVRRFRLGTEWAYSDFSGRRLLQSLAPSVYPTDITVSQQDWEKQLQY